MSDVKFQQAHNLGLEKARELAKQWAEDSAKQMGLSCKHVEGAEEDTLTFERMGVNGVMTVTGTSFDMNIKLGMMMAAFKPMIESEIQKNLGRIIGKASGQA
ncbi:MAG: polyhydroxyalkanoic acid system family protein [Aquabacterium sp.]|nr:polyhydroxyalkanoic acid system family protein [Aquabacterium sp.]